MDSPNTFQSDSGSPSGDVAERITSLMHFDSVMPSDEDALDQGPMERHLRTSSEFPHARPKSSPAAPPPSRSSTHPASASSAQPRTAHAQASAAQPAHHTPAAASATASLHRPADGSKPLQQPMAASNGPAQSSPTQRHAVGDAAQSPTSNDHGHFATSSPRSGQSNPGLARPSPLKQPTPFASGSAAAAAVLPGPPVTPTRPIAAPTQPSPAAPSSTARPAAVVMSAPESSSGVSSRPAAAQRDLPPLMDFGEPDRPDEPTASSSGRAGHQSQASHLSPSLLDADVKVSIQTLHRTQSQSAASPASSLFSFCDNSPHECPSDGGKVWCCWVAAVAILLWAACGVTPCASLPHHVLLT